MKKSLLVVFTIVSLSSALAFDAVKPKVEGLVTVDFYRTNILGEDFSPKVTPPHGSYLRPVNDEASKVKRIVKEQYESGDMEMPNLKGLIFIPYDPFGQVKLKEKRKGRFPDWGWPLCVGSRAKTEKTLYVGLCAYEFLVGTPEQIEKAISQDFVSSTYRKTLLVVINYNDKGGQTTKVVTDILLDPSWISFPTGTQLFPYFVSTKDDFVVIGPAKPFLEITK